ncbi:hypothetical protein PPL_01768 [Heterostelium album PN500]|uniref:Expansin-like EG45 domain-containing protein n=1 Tax=Heterostelium pallidum (strain ATCC 26659 / Pp 5 / PN500) TaxID=670386 RepID=D3B0F2_HETP5|nr:hypothetical protein PPL_01768 [Heterostelium album PN500]EFA84776.1 hypothetical protein PPL_01768 [Heterostelium album PN500]|eukprot:XP_020436888.1 hypothetical protein PPL_01768 [Heterostelium album PN500]
MEIKRIFLYAFLIVVLFNKISESCEEDSEKSVCSATYYTTPNNGACGYQDLFGPTVALSTKYFNGASSCGVCFNVYQNNSDPITVIVTDECPAQYNQEHCAGPNAHFDLSVDAFQELAELKIGVLGNLQYEMVPCDSQGTIKVKTKDGSNDNWAGFMFFNHRVGIQSMAIQTDINQPYQEIPRTDYNYFIVSQNLAGSYSLKIKSIFNEEIIVKMNGVQANSITDSGLQFTSFDGCDIPPIASSAFTIASPVLLILIVTVFLSIFI